MERVQDTSLLIGRLLMGALFLVSGIYKVAVTGQAGVAKYFGFLGLPYPDVLAIVAIVIEILFGIALILGVFPRISALVLIAFVIIATAAAHRFWEFPSAEQFGQMNHFLKNVAVLAGLLFYYVSGAGAWAMAGRRAGSGAGAPARA